MRGINYPTCKGNERKYKERVSFRGLSYFEVAGKFRSLFLDSVIDIGKVFVF
jgi:hypothetical protein